MAVDWATILASGAIGAFAGGTVSWIDAPHVAGRQERGQARTDARRKLRALIDPVLTDVRQYQDHARGNLSREGENGKQSLHSGDITLCSNLLSAAEGLPRWRRNLVKRRLVQLFGPVTVNLCEVHGAFGSDGEAALGIILNRQMNAMKNPERFSQPDRGDFDKAFRCEPDSKEVAALIQSLSKMRNSR